jgi:predicted CoA-binding protein
MNREEALIQRLLKRARTVAVIGASPRKHSAEVVHYLHQAGYDVIPVRPDRAPVDRLPTYARLDDVRGAIDLVVIFRRPEAAVTHIHEAGARHAEAVWLPPGVWSRAAQEEAERQGLAVIKDRCIADEHRHLFSAHGEPRSGHPAKTGVHLRRRGRAFEDDRVRPEDEGYVSEGGGGHKGGGGVRSVLDEKKMVRGRPSPRSGPMKPKPV